MTIIDAKATISRRKAILGLGALTLAGACGIDDLEAGRFHELDSTAELERHLNELAESALRGPQREDGQ